MKKESLKLFKSIKTHNIEEMDIYQVYGFVIRKMGQVEKLVDGIITKFINPEKEETFKDVVLNSSIITWNGKIIILKNILPKKKKDLIEKIEKMTSIRNLFAHHNTFMMAAPKDLSKKTAESILDITERLVKGESSFKKLSRSGKTSTVSAWDKVKEYETLWKEISPRLMVMYHIDINKDLTA